MLKDNWEDFIPNVKRLFYNDGHRQTFISYWKGWGGWLTAGHCLTECALNTPKDTPNFELWEHRMKGVDISTYGFKDLCPSVISPYVNQEVVALGFPAGSRNIEVRRGWIHMEREEGIWIAGIKTPAEPVVVGMSGGMVLGKDKKTMKWGPIGVTIHRNSPAALDGDAKADESLDFVALNYAFNEIKGQLDLFS